MSPSEKYTSTNPDFDNKDFDFFDEYKKIVSPKRRIDFCISYIRAKLNRQSISAIVGAGFSKNASPNFPDWAGLLTDAYVEMNEDQCKRKEGESVDVFRQSIAEKIHRKGEPAVASEYERYKGMRESLDLYIEKHISKVQNETLNLNVHQDFLNLNWCDVITTNWDCLLEKADEKTNQYSLVKNAKDLRKDNKKRIIKIHGSIRENDPEDGYEFDGCFDHLYIITEKDYEEYHVNHEGFSNFMRVKMLENSLCLFGFSGTDWNFRFWVKELKRMMTKGGETKNLNPIFLFDVTSGEHDLAENQFFENNYIVPLKIDDVLNYINEILGNVETNVFNLSVNEKFSKIFEFLAPSEENSIFEQNKIDYEKGRTLLQDLLNGANETSLKKLIDEYPQLPAFGLFNLSYTRVIVRKIQAAFSQVEQWTEKEYQFVYSWCINNFFSLSQLFRFPQIEAIVKRYIDKKYYLGQAKDFADIIFKHYVDFGKESDIDLFASKVERIDDDLTLYHKVKFYIKELEYPKLNDILTNWTIENNENANPRFLLCKINGLIAFENFRFASSHSAQIEKLFEKALQVSNNDKYFQLHIFILLFCKYYLLNSGKRLSEEMQSELESLRYKKCDYPSDYIDILFDNKKKESVQPNSKKRYQNTKTLSIDNFDSVSSRRILNFFDYTALPMLFFFSESKFMHLVEEKYADSYFLSRLFSSAIPYYGRSSDEDFLRCVVPSIFRNLNPADKKYVFEKIFKIFKYKIKNNENPRSFCYIMDELSKRVDKSLRKKYFDLFFEHFSQHNGKQNVLENLVDNGPVWGVHFPFMNVLSNLENEKKFQYVLDWLINRKLSEGPDNFSGYLSYYDTLIRNVSMKNCLKKYFKSPEVIEKFKNSIEKSLYLILDAYDFQTVDMKNFIKDYLSNNMTLNINPYYVQVCYSSKLKQKLLDLIINKNYKMESSSEWPICDYIKVLHDVGKLDAEELNLICQSIKGRILQQINDSYKGIDSLFEWDLQHYYEVIKMSASDLHAEQKESIKECLDYLAPIYTNEATAILKYDWINTENGQDLRNNFYKAFSFAEFLHEEDGLIRYVGLMLAKMLTQDSSYFEAILEIFLYKCKTDIWRNRITKDETIKFYVKCLIEKFEKSVPMCYDDLFINKKIRDLKKIFGFKRGLGNQRSKIKRA